VQLKGKKSPLSLALATATSSLLTGAAAAVADGDVGWEINSSVLYYGEQDDRVQDASLTLAGTRRYEDGRQLSLGITLDSLTGASPTGAAPSSQPQTFTSPSAIRQYVIEPSATPTDDTFKDSRSAAYASWTQPLDEGWSATAGLSFSTEFDYQHIGINGSISHEFDKGNRTISAGFALAQDQLDPEGGVPVPLAEMRGVDIQSNKIGGTRDKTVKDLLLGVTQVISENMIAQVNYSYSQSDDYLNDPYKFLSVLDNQGDLIPGPDGLNSYRFEQRPDKRIKHSLFAKLKTYIRGGALDTSYRFMTDDWGLDSHTIDLRYRINFSAGSYIQPHVRLYTQSQADFFKANLAAADPLPVYVTADYRLAEFRGTTLGLKFGHHLKNGNELSARIEWYNQSGKANLLHNSRNVFPDLDALIVQLNYRFSR